MKLRSGDWVEVRCKEEILGTLDGRGRLDGLPFMPQMFRYCGQRARVYKRAHKTCEWVYTLMSRRVPRAVHLDFRCDGEAYGGCQTLCLIYWKEDWLEPAKASRKASTGKIRSEIRRAETAVCTEADVWAGTLEGDPDGKGEPRYICQGTQVPDFSTPLHRLDFRQYLEDYTSGNFGLGRVLLGLYNALANRRRIGRPLRWFYDVVQRIRSGTLYPNKKGTVPAGQRTPTCELNLQPGEMVRVKSYEEILSTLNARGENRGLHFDAEMTPYCGGTYRVKKRLNKYIDEKTGKLMTMKNEVIVLEDVICQSRFSTCRILCPRSIYSWWREIWLERIPEISEGPPG